MLAYLTTPSISRLQMVCMTLACLALANHRGLLCLGILTAGATIEFFLTRKA